MAVPKFYSSNSMPPAGSRDVNGIYFVKTTTGYTLLRVANTPGQELIPMDIPLVEGGRNVLKNSSNLSVTTPLNATTVGNTVDGYTNVVTIASPTGYCRIVTDIEYNNFEKYKIAVFGKSAAALTSTTFYIGGAYRTIESQPAVGVWGWFIISGTYTAVQITDIRVNYPAAAPFHFNAIMVEGNVNSFTGYSPAASEIATRIWVEAKGYLSEIPTFQETTTAGNMTDKDITLTAVNPNALVKKSTTTGIKDVIRFDTDETKARIAFEQTADNGANFKMFLKYASGAEKEVMSIDAEDNAVFLKGLEGAGEGAIMAGVDGVLYKRLSHHSVSIVTSSIVLGDGIGTLIFANTIAVNVTLPPPTFFRTINIRITAGAATVTLIGTYKVYDFEAGTETDISADFDAKFRNGGGMIQANGTKWYLIQGA